MTDRALADLGASGKVISGQGACRLASQPPPPPQLAAERQRIVEIYLARTFESPRVTSLAEEFGWQEAQARSHLQYLTDSGVLVKIADDLYLHTDTVSGTLAKLRQVIAEGGEIDTSEFKNQLNVSRKLLIPLLEYFDKCGVTIREGNKRFLRSSRR